jgi:hypothetical protein
MVIDIWECCFEKEFSNINFNELHVPRKWAIPHESWKQAKISNASFWTKVCFIINNNSWTYEKYELCVHGSDNYFRGGPQSRPLIE